MTIFLVSVLCYGQILKALSCALSKVSPVNQIKLSKFHYLKHAFRVGRDLITGEQIQFLFPRVDSIV
jgi:hypothetical protein